MLTGIARLFPVAALLLAGCQGEPDVTLRIVSGSENASLEPLIQDWAEDNNVAVEMTYLGSAEIARSLEGGESIPYDAVWPAHSLWLAMGDSQSVTRHATSIFRSPIVLSVRGDIADQLGWSAPDARVEVADIADAAAAGRLPLAMTSATQSNSGASALFAFIHAFAGQPDVLGEELLADPAVIDPLRALLSGVDRGSGSSGWLKNSLVENPDAFSAMINYEVMAIEANTALEEAGQTAYRVIYPADSIAVADSPLAFVDRGPEDDEVEAVFRALQAFLLSDEVVDELRASGRRAGGLAASTRPIKNADKWAPWGVDLSTNISPPPVPTPNVARAALQLYQSEWRKPSLTVWLLDVSGSMEGSRLDGLKDAMGLLLDPERAATFLLQPTDDDMSVIIPFNSFAGEPTLLTGGSETVLAKGRSTIDNLAARGGTDIYVALGAAIDILEQLAADGELDGRLLAIAALSDGASEEDNRSFAINKYRSSDIASSIPIHTLAFGAADPTQLNELSDISIGRAFSAGDDPASLARALRSIRGYN